MRLPEQGDSGHITRGSGRLHLSMRLPEEGDSGHITHGVGGCICPCVCRSRETVATSLVEWEAASVHASAGAGRQWPHHSWSGRLHLSMRLPEQGDSGHITQEWKAASVRVHLPEQGDSGHITRGVGGCISPASAGAGRQWPHHSWSGGLHLSMRLPEQGDSGHITR